MGFKGHSLKRVRKKKRKKKRTRGHNLLLQANTALKKEFLPIPFPKLRQLDYEPAI